jgi:hypothetical protein
MSTTIYLECRSHTPPLVADRESGQHLSDLEQIRCDIKHRDDVVDVMEDGWSHPDPFRMATARFLADHQSCDIGIRDEYGTDHPLTAPEEKS